MKLRFSRIERFGRLRAFGFGVDVRLEGFGNDGSQR